MTQRNLAFALILLTLSCTSVPENSRRVAAEPVTKSRTSLWENVNAECIQSQKSNSDPCIVTDMNKGYVLLKDPKGPTHFLVIPTKPVSGIEDSQVLAGNAPNYWQIAWESSGHVGKILNKPLTREMIGLAVNPPYARSQDQLHVHIDCVQASVQAYIAAHQNEIGSSFGTAALEVNGVPYYVMFLPQVNLKAANPFQVLKSHLPDASEMGKHTMIVIGAKNGFYIFTAKTNPDDKAHRAHGEDLLDAKCTVVN